MLNGHSQIKIPPEAWFVFDLFQNLPDDRPLGLNLQEQAKYIIFHNERWPDWICSEKKFDLAMSFDQAPYLHEYIDQLFRNCSPLRGGHFWGEKSPRNAYYITKLRKIFPDARFIHLIRNGFDCCLSIKKRGWYQKSFRRACQHWDEVVNQALIGRNFGESSYLEVHYEELVSEPSKILSDVCRFLKIPYEASMIDFSSRICSDIPTSELGYHDAIKKGLQNTTKRAHISASSWYEKRIFHIICGETYQKVGYPPLITRMGKIEIFMIKNSISLTKIAHNLFHFIVSGFRFRQPTET